MNAFARFLHRLKLATFAQDLGAKLENPEYVYELWPYLVECGRYEDDPPPWTSSRESRALRNLDELRHLCAACRRELASLSPDRTLERTSVVLSSVAEKLNESPEGRTAAAVLALVEAAEFAGGPELRGLAEVLEDTSMDQYNNLPSDLQFRDWGADSAGEADELTSEPQPDDGGSDWSGDADHLPLEPGGSDGSAESAGEADDSTSEHQPDERRAESTRHKDCGHRAKASRKNDPALLQAALDAWHHWSSRDPNHEPASARDLLNQSLGTLGWDKTRLSRAFRMLFPNGGHKQYTLLLRSGNVKSVRDLLDSKNVRCGSADDLLK